MCFDLSRLVAYLLAVGLWKTGFFVYFVTYFLQKTSSTSYLFAYREFMLPKRTTCNSLSAYFDMATDPENSNLDLSPVSPELSVLSSSSAGSANIAPGSSLGPGIIKKFHHQSNSPTP